MEDILASIKRIIADEGATAVPPRPHRGMDGGLTAPVLELVDPAPPEPEPAPFPSVRMEPPPPPRPAPVEAPPAKAAPDPAILSDQAAQASRHALAALSQMVVRPAAAQPATSLEDLVRDMLTPMLKEWLDARMPEIVEKLVAREIARITGNSF